MASEAAAGARVGVGLALRHANELAVALVLLHGALRVQRAHARGHLVTGASPATSPCGDGYGEQGGDGYGDRTVARLGGNDRGLTAVTKSFSPSSGRHGRRRIDGGVAGGRSSKTMTMRSLQGVRSGFFWWRGVARGGGATGHPS